MTPLAWIAIILIIALVVGKNWEKIQKLFNKPRKENNNENKKPQNIEQIRKEKIEYLEQAKEKRLQKIEQIKQQYNHEIQPITEEIQEIETEIELLQPTQTNTKKPFFSKAGSE